MCQIDPTLFIKVLDLGSRIENQTPAIRENFSKEKLALKLQYQDYEMIIMTAL